MTYNLDCLPADFIGYIRALQAHAGHETNAYRLARALNVHVRVGMHNLALPDAEPDPLILVQPWWYGWSNQIIRHELAHVALFWSGLESQVLAAYGPEMGWVVIENLCKQAEAFLQITQPQLDQTVRQFGVTSRTVTELSRMTGARLEIALRRLIYDKQEEERAGFLTAGPYIAQVEQCNLGLPFGWSQVVRKPRDYFPSWAKLSVSPIRGTNRSVVGVCWT